ncbi:MAG: hypothetical protein ACRCXT_18230 [Paraclostridium sp.]
MDLLKGSGSGLINFDFFTNGKATLKGTGLDSGSETSKKKPGRPKKVIEVNPNESTDNTTSEVSYDSQLAPHQTNEPYLNTYSQTNGLLQAVYVETDMLQNEIKEELATLRASKTMKKKYDYMVPLMGTAGNGINTKLGIIKEMNKVITDSNNLDLKRVKELKLNDKDNVDNDKYIMDMYNAFISTPVGNYNAPDISQLTSDVNNLNNRIGIGQNGFEGYMSNISPSQNMMLLESNPNIKTVVVQDAATGNTYFDVMDITTRQSIPNADKPDAMFMEGMAFDHNNGVARNKNLDTSYDLIVINDNNMMHY